MKIPILVIGLLLLISSVSAAQYFVARGDEVSVPETKPGGTCWFFPSTGSGTYYDIPAKSGINISYCRLEPSDTIKLPPATYTLLYQEPVFVNGKLFKDVSWKDNKLISSFAKTESIDESGRQGPDVLNDLKGILISNGFNTFTEDQVVLQEPVMAIRGMEQTGENQYTAYGTSNYANNTQIAIKIDYERYRALQDDSFTYYGSIVRNPNSEYGQWRTNLLMPLQDMPAGWHNISVFVRDIETTSRFKIDEQEWAPAPTPTRYVKYLSNGDIEPDKIYINTTIIQEKIVTQWHTATPTPDIVDALGDTINYPYDRGDTLKNEWILGMAAGLIVLVVIVMIMRRWAKE